MLDIRLFRENPDIVRKALKDRQSDASVVDTILALDESRRELLGEVEKLKAERNAVSKEIGKMKDADSRQEKIDAMRAVGDQIKALDEKLRDVDAELRSTMANLPNIPSEATPYGTDESENVVLKAVVDIP